MLGATRGEARGHQGADAPTQGTYTIVYIIGELLQAARRGSGLTQAEVAARAGTVQPVVSTYERGLRDPSVQTLRQLLAGSGHALVLDVVSRGSGAYVPMSAADLADELARAAAPRRKRLMLEFLRGYQDEPVADRRGLVADEPRPVTAKWDALLAGCAEHLAIADADRPPQWCFDASRFLSRAWFWDDLPTLRRRALLTSPASFRRRNVWIDRADLESV